MMDFMVSLLTFCILIVMDHLINYAKIELINIMNTAPNYFIVLDINNLDYP